MMSANEFVVVQVWTRYEGHTDGRWLDYSRCTAGQARQLLSVPPTSGRTGERLSLRAKHWVSGEPLNAKQLGRMAVDEMARWENVQPGDGDFWTVSLVFDGGAGEEIERVTTVDGWTGRPWQLLTEDIAALTAVTGWTVKSLRLTD